MTQQKFLPEDDATVLCSEGFCPRVHINQYGDISYTENKSMNNPNWYEKIRLYFNRFGKKDACGKPVSFNTRNADDSRQCLGRCIIKHDDVYEVCDLAEAIYTTDGRAMHPMKMRILRL